MRTPPRNNRGLKEVAQRVYMRTREKRDNEGCLDIPAVSFDELKLPFQHPLVMDLRDLGFLALSSTKDGKCGVILREPYASLTRVEFNDFLKKLC